MTQAGARSDDGTAHRSEPGEPIDGAVEQTPSGASEAGPRRPRAPRRTALERREEFVARAASFFAEAGFSGTTRALAEQLGVRQALLYRYFASKEALVEAVFARVFSERWHENFAVLLADRTRPLEDRLTEVYRTYAARDHGLSLRLVLRAALDGYAVPAGRGSPVTAQIVEPLIAELRHEARLPDLSRAPLLKSERDMAMMLHASIVFQGIREHVYRQPVATDRDAVVGLYCQTFLAGAREQIRRLHQRPARPPVRSGERAAARR